MSVRILSLIAIAAVSNWSMALEVVTSDVLCQQERANLRAIQDHIHPKVQCREQIESAAKCCAGDNRKECTTTGIPLSASTGSNAAADLSIRSSVAIVQLIGLNLSRCNRQAEKVHCSANDASAAKVYYKTQGALTECLETFKAGYEADARQAKASYDQSYSADREPTSASANGDEDYHNLVHHADATGSDLAADNVQNVAGGNVGIQVPGNPKQGCLPYSSLDATLKWLKESGVNAYPGAGNCK